MSLFPNMPTHLTRHQKLYWKQIPKPSFKCRAFLISVEQTWESGVEQTHVWHLEKHASSLALTFQETVPVLVKCGRVKK